MNIFVLDLDPVLAAKYHNDKHTVKMVLEYAQLLSTAHRLLDEYEGDDMYKATHKNHPSAVWTRETSQNYKWVYDLFCYTCDEYTRRYGKVHLTDKKLRDRLSFLPKNINYGEKTQFALAMPDDCKSDDPVQSYRNYYMTHKRDLAQWKTEVPFWYE